MAVGIKLSVIASAVDKDACGRKLIWADRLRAWSSENLFWRASCLEEVGHGSGREKRGEALSAGVDKGRKALKGPVLAREKRGSPECGRG